jgi:2,4-didehydro-3-deoxy-L-rhamnonate hydrolase
MQQFVRVQQGNAVIAALVSDAGLQDLRSLVSDISPETIASGVLTNVNAALLKPLAGEVRYLTPSTGMRQIAATGFNYKKHIEETPNEPEVFLKSMLSLTRPFDHVGRGSNRGIKLDWETELAIVVGREVQGITAERLLATSSATFASTMQSVDSGGCAETTAPCACKVARNVLPDRVLSDYSYRSNRP